MKKIILCSCATLLMIANTWAHDGHDHGNSAFENQRENIKEFELTDTQIHNLHLQTATVMQVDFFDTVEIPMIIDTMHYQHPLAHGFVYEGNAIMKIKKGQKVYFSLDVLPEKTFQGEIVRVEDMIDPQSRLYSVYASTDETFPKNTQGLKGNMVIMTTAKKKSIGIPVSALQGEFGNYFVFLKHGNHFERRDVELGHKTGNMIEISGVCLGETVVTAGSYQLRYVTGTPINNEHKDLQDKELHDHLDQEQHITQ